MKIWQDRNSEPYVHFVHMFEAIGSLFSPIIGAQLLPGRNGKTNWDFFPTVMTPIQSYFLLMGLLPLMVAPVHLYLGWVDYQKIAKKDSKDRYKVKPEPKSRTLKILVISFGILYFLRTPLPLLGILITSFGKSSPLELSSAEGAELSALFWTSMIAIRILFIALSNKIDGRRSIHFLMAMCMLSCLYVLLRQSDLTLLELQICLCTAAMGAGPQFAINLVLFKEFSPVDVSVSGMFLLGHILGMKVFSTAMGFFIEDYPYVMFYVPAINTSVCMAIYVILEIFRDRIRKAL